MQELLQGEQLLQQLFTRAFPSVAPLMPGGPYNEELAIALEEEEKQVCGGRGWGMEGRWKRGEGGKRGLMRRWFLATLSKRKLQ